MELLKSNPIIDDKYQPSPVLMGYLDYFNRAMAFAQTNYSEQLDKVSKINFIKLSPTIFFEQYVWCIVSNQESSLEVSKYFPDLSKQLTPLFHSFWDLNLCPNLDSLKQNINLIIKNQEKTDALIDCAKIINRGIKLFEWEYYKNNFLNTPEKLCALPHLELTEATHLARNIGTASYFISSFRIFHLATRWGFVDVKSLCQAIQHYFPLQLKIIELILWYASATFETDLLNRDIVSVD